jgi:RNA recognition motif-containing protein
MNIIREIHHLNETELTNCTPLSSSYHYNYLFSPSAPIIFIAGVDPSLNEFDILTIFSQFGEIADLHLIRDRSSGKSRGFAFLEYHDKLSTILAIDNFNGIQLGSKVMRVDHAEKYNKKKDIKKKKGQTTKIEEQEEEDDRDGDFLSDEYSLALPSLDDPLVKQRRLLVWDAESYPISTESPQQTQERIQRFLLDGSLNSSKSNYTSNSYSVNPNSLVLAQSRAVMEDADKRIQQEMKRQQENHQKDNNNKKDHEGGHEDQVSHISRLLANRRKEFEEIERKEKQEQKQENTRKRERMEERNKTREFDTQKQRRK